MAGADKLVCAICGRSIVSNEDLHEDFDKLQNVWNFHNQCFEKFNHREYKKK